MGNRDWGTGHNGYVPSWERRRLEKIADERRAREKQERDAESRGERRGMGSNGWDD